MQQALVMHRAGRVADAEAVYQALLLAAPDHPDVLHLLGTALTQLGRPAEAVPLLEQATGRLPASSPCQAHLGDALAAA
ncbi:MAG TPA: tetratricopeptide repeat protein, partial [Thalassobaculum sp.]